MGRLIAWQMARPSNHWPAQTGVRPRRLQLFSPNTRRPDQATRASQLVKRRQATRDDIRSCHAGFSFSGVRTPRYASNTVQTIGYRMLGDDLMVFVSGEASPSELEWQGYLRTLEDAVQRARQTGGPLNFFIFVDEGAPNPKQRGAVVDALRGLSTHTAVVTTSKLARHLITVFGWFGLTLRGFSPLQLEAAAEYLELAPGRLLEVIEVAGTLAPTVGGVSSFKEATGAQASAPRRA
jgi:hypothetical protein